MRLGLNEPAFREGAADRAAIVVVAAAVEEAAVAAVSVADATSDAHQHRAIGTRRSALLDFDVFPEHLYAAAGVKLQADDALGEFRRRIMVIHDLNAVQPRR